jgi:hypothetical protein
VSLHKGDWVIHSRISVLTDEHTYPFSISPNPLIPSRISVIIDQLNSVTKEYDLENVSGRCKHQHSLSAREAFSTTPSLSWKYSNFVLVRGLVRTLATCSSVGRYCTNTSFLCTMSWMKSCEKPLKPHCFHDSRHWLRYIFPLQY